MPRAMDLMLHNDKNTPPFPVMQGPAMAMAMLEKEDVPDLQQGVVIGPARSHRGHEPTRRRFRDGDSSRPRRRDILRCHSRGDLAGAAPLPDAQVLDPDSHTMVPLIGHAVWGLTEGKAAITRWLAMATSAFTDLRRTRVLPGPDDAGFWRRTGIVLVGPDLDDDRFTFSLPCYPEMIGETVR